MAIFNSYVSLPETSTEFSNRSGFDPVRICLGWAWDGLGVKTLHCSIPRHWGRPNESHLQMGWLVEYGKITTFFLSTIENIIEAFGKLWAMASCESALSLWDDKKTKKYSATGHTSKHQKSNTAMFKSLLFPCTGWLRTDFPVQRWCWWSPGNIPFNKLT